eukprot:67614-Hanusia_phi.AAC.2
MRVVRVMATLLFYDVNGRGIEGRGSGLQAGSGGLIDFIPIRRLLSVPAVKQSGRKASANRNAKQSPIKRYNRIHRIKNLWCCFCLVKASNAHSSASQGYKNLYGATQKRISDIVGLEGNRQMMQREGGREGGRERQRGKRGEGEGQEGNVNVRAVAKDDLCV